MWKTYQWLDLDIKKIYNLYIFFKNFLIPCNFQTGFSVTNIFLTQSCAMDYSGVPSTNFHWYTTILTGSDKFNVIKVPDQQVLLLKYDLLVIRNDYEWLFFGIK